MGAEAKLREWVKQGPECRVTPFEWAFLANVRAAAKLGVGYGWMQQVAEWEWQDKCERDGLPGGSWGPEYYGRLVAELERKNADLLAACKAFLWRVREFRDDPRLLLNLFVEVEPLVERAVAKAEGEG